VVMSQDNGGNVSPSQMAGATSVPSVTSSVNSTPSSERSICEQEFRSQRQLLFALCPEMSPGGRRKCIHCDCDYDANTTTQPLLYHFQTKHKAQWATYERTFLKHSKRDGNQPTLVQTYDGKAFTDGFQDVVTSFILHPGLPLSLADCPAFRRTLKYPQGVTSKSIRDAILSRDTDVLFKLRRLLKSKVVGLQVDGGKTVSHTKVLGLGFTLQGAFYCWAIVPLPPGAVWDSITSREIGCGMISLKLWCVAALTRVQWPETLHSYLMTCSMIMMTMTK